MEKGSILKYLQGGGDREQKELESHKNNKRKELRKGKRCRKRKESKYNPSDNVVNLFAV